MSKLYLFIFVCFESEMQQKDHHHTGKNPVKKMEILRQLGRQKYSIK